MGNLSPLGWALRPLKNYANFSGRAPRAEFWWFFLFAMILYLALWVVAFAVVGGVASSQNGLSIGMIGAFGGSGMGNLSPLAFAVVGGVASSQNGLSIGMIGAFGVVGILMILFWLALLIPTIAVQARRLHDTGRSGWWLGAFYLLYVVYLAMTLGAMPSAIQPGPPQNTGLMVGVMILGLAFFVYSIALLVFYCLPGTPGENRYGPDPYGADVGEVFA